MIIITSSNSKDIYRKAISMGTDADFYINSIQQNINELYYLAFLPEANALKERAEAGFDKIDIKKTMSGSSFRNMMVEEILNELSNILGDKMQNITEENSASMESYIAEQVIPGYINKFLGGENNGE